MSHEIQQIPAVICMSVAVLSHPSVLDHPWQTTTEEAEPMKWLRMWMGSGEEPSHWIEQRFEILDVVLDVISIPPYRPQEAMERSVLGLSTEDG